MSQGEDRDGDDVDGATQQKAQLVLKKWVMKLLDEIYRGEEPELQWVRLDGFEKSLTSKWGLLGLTTLMKHRPSIKVKETQTKSAVLKVNFFTRLGRLSKARGIGR